MRAEPQTFARGFSLIEVLVALIVVSLGMLGVIQTVSQTAGNSTYMRDKMVAHWIAMNQLTQVRLQPNSPAVSKTSDEIEMAGRKWRWTMEVKQTPVESIRRIDVSVRPLEAPEKSSMAVVSGFYGAAIAAPGTTLVSWQGTNGPPGSGGQGREGTRPPDDESSPGVQSPSNPEPGEPVESPPIQEPDS